MSTDTRALRFVYDGWDGYHRSIVGAVAPLTTGQLEYRVPGMRSVGDVAWHIARGRVDWFHRIDAPGSAELFAEIDRREASDLPFQTEELVDWLERTWRMVEATLDQWTVDDLAVTYEHPYQGKVYAVSRQWTIWRIMAHDIHHGGQLSEMLAMQGIEPLELTLLGGHLTEPPIVS